MSSFAAMKETVAAMSHVELKDDLLRRNLPTDGSKEDMQSRLLGKMEIERDLLERNEVEAKMKGEMEKMRQIDLRMRRDALSEAMHEYSLRRQNKYPAPPVMPTYSGPTLYDGPTTSAPRIVDASKRHDRGLFRRRARHGWYQHRRCVPLYGTQEEPRPSCQDYDARKPPMVAPPSVTLAGKGNFSMFLAAGGPGPIYDTRPGFGSDPTQGKTLGGRGNFTIFPRSDNPAPNHYRPLQTQTRRSANPKHTMAGRGALVMQ